MSDDEELLTQYSQAPLDIEELLRMHEANPDNINVLDCIAFSYYTKDDLDKALEYYKKILAKDPSQSNAHYYVGNVLFRRRQLVAAMMSWKKVVALDGDSKLAKNAQERIEMAMERVREMK